MTIRTGVDSWIITTLLSSVLVPLTVTAANPAITAVPKGCELAVKPVETYPSDVTETLFPPPQFEVRTPVKPRLLPSGGRNYLVYELHLQNFGAEAAQLRGIQVLDADSGGVQPIAEYKDERLSTVLRPVGNGDISDKRQLGSGLGAVAFLCVAFNGDTPVPGKLRHRIVLDTAVVVGPFVERSRAPLPVLSRPVAGTGWSPANGPHADSHHRFGLLVADGQAQLSRRYAIDWKITKDGQQFAGDARDVRSYYAYGAKVFAVGAGTVVVAKDGFPDNVPRTPEGFSPAVPLTMDSIAGNTVVIKLTDGSYASYAHLQPGSVRVKVGERVRSGQYLARIGNSGDARWPHLHFQVTSNAHILASEGLPFVIERFRIKHAGSDWVNRTHDFPWGNTAVVDFGPDESDRRN